MGNVLSKILPARAQAAPIKVVADLDQLVPEPFGFRLGGRVYQIRVGTIRKLAGLQDKLIVIVDLLRRIGKGEKVPDVELHKAYHQYLSVLCPEMTLETVQSMTSPQLQRLLKEIHNYATGQNEDQDETAPVSANEKKKKNP